MRLLVSIRDAGEVEAALRGGADIIDAKDPTRGALAAVAAGTLRAIDDRVPLDVPFSVALGEADWSVVAGILQLQLRRRAAPIYLKLGLAAVPTRDLPALLAGAVDAARRHPARPQLIAVDYADRSRPEPPDFVQTAAAAAGAVGVLVDTGSKNGRNLFDWWSVARLWAWIEAARARRLSVAVAGSLGAEDLGRIAPLGPDVVGVRGAACSGGRSGRVVADRVRVLRAAIQGGIQTHCEARESRYPVRATSHT